MVPQLFPRANFRSVLSNKQGCKSVALVKDRVNENTSPRQWESKFREQVRNCQVFSLIATCVNGC